MKNEPDVRIEFRRSPWSGRQEAFGRSEQPRQPERPGAAGDGLEPPWPERDEWRPPGWRPTAGLAAAAGLQGEQSGWDQQST